jgi:hypothetical protein
MSYRITLDEHRRPTIALLEEPPYCHALEAAPSAREPELETGVWLVMAFAVWSVPDNAAVQTALDAAKRFGGKVNLGVRPYDDWQELSALCSGVEEDGHSPLWLLLSNGEVRMKRKGVLTVDELVEMIKIACPACTPYDG